MTVPHEKSNTHSTGESNRVSFDMNIPVVHHISSAAIEKLGWIKFDKNTWLKGGRKIKYDGVTWLLDGNKVEFLEDLKQ